MNEFHFFFVGKLQINKSHALEMPFRVPHTMCVQFSFSTTTTKKTNARCYNKSGQLGLSTQSHELNAHFVQQ